jgi:hypothetical protein
MDIFVFQNKTISMKLKLFLTNKFQNHPVIGAFLAQVISLVLIKFLIQIFQHNLNTLHFVFLQALLSVVISQMIFKLPKWFFTISILFPVLFVLAFRFAHIESSVYGILFLFLALTFSHTLKERVPLYLTNKKTHDALKKVIDERQAHSFVDLGSGLGGVVRAMACSSVTSVGVESAPMLWGVSAILSLLFLKGKILRQNIWNTDLRDYDVVYAFLSPAIMDKLFKKIKSEMKNGSVFVSNSFEVKGIPADEIWQLEDARKTQLYFYRIKK